MCVWNTLCHTLPIGSDVKTAIGPDHLKCRSDRVRWRMAVRPGRASLPMALDFGSPHLHLHRTMRDGRQRACAHAEGLAIVPPGEAARIRCIVVRPPDRLRSASPSLGLGLVAAARHSSPWGTESRHRRVAPGFLSFNLNPRNPKLNHDATVFLSVPMARPCCNNFRGCFSRRGIRGFWC